MRMHIRTSFMHIYTHTFNDLPPFPPNYISVHKCMCLCIFLILSHSLCLLSFFLLLLSPFPASLLLSFSYFPFSPSFPFFCLFSPLLILSFAAPLLPSVLPSVLPPSPLSLSPQDIRHDRGIMCAVMFLTAIVTMSPCLFTEIWQLFDIFDVAPSTCCFEWVCFCEHGCGSIMPHVFLDIVGHTGTFRTSMFSPKHPALFVSESPNLGVRCLSGFRALFVCNSCVVML